MSVSTEDSSAFAEPFDVEEVIKCELCAAELPDGTSDYFGSLDLCATCAKVARRMHARAPQKTCCGKCGGEHKGSVASGRKWFSEHPCSTSLAA